MSIPLKRVVDDMVKGLDAETKIKYITKYHYTDGAEETVNSTVPAEWTNEQVAELAGSHRKFRTRTVKFVDGPHEY